MNDSKFSQRANKMIEVEFGAARGQPNWFYLSYASEEGFLGGAYVLGYGPVSATAAARQKGISPGGEVMIFPVPKAFEHELPPPAFRERLLSRSEIEALDEDEGKA